MSMSTADHLEAALDIAINAVEAARHRYEIGDTARALILDATDPDMARWIALGCLADLEANPEGPKHPTRQLADIGDILTDQRI